jgi:hypothetical protein
MTTTTLRIVAGPCVVGVSVVENVFLGPVVVNDATVGRLINEPNGGLRMETWAKGIGWVAAPEGSMALADFMPGKMKPVSAELAAREGMPKSEI